MGQWKKIYNAKQWKQTRNLIIRRDGYLCQECLARGKKVAGQEVHHIENLNKENVNNDKIVYGHDNLILLCKDCHFKKHVQKNKSSLSDFL